MKEVAKVSRKDLAKKIDHDTPMVPAGNEISLKESPVKNYQHNNIRHLYKREMDIIVEGFDNI